MSQPHESLITEELRAWIGKTTPVKALEMITASTVRRYVDATRETIIHYGWMMNSPAPQATTGGFYRLLSVGWLPFSIRRGDDSMGFDAADLRRHLPLPKEYTNIRNARNVQVELEWLRAVYLGEALSTQSGITDMVAREGKRGWGIYVTQENRILDERNEVVLRRRQTVVLLPESKFSQPSKN